MSAREPTSHLRLVVRGPRAGSPESPESENSPQQLSLWYPDPSAIFLVCVTWMGREEFVAVLERCLPQWVIDVRVVPRFDRIAASRSEAFRLFERLGVTYVDLFGRLGIRSYASTESNPTKWGDAVADLLRNSSRRGPYVFLLDDEKLTARTRLILPSVVREVVGGGLRIETIAHLE